VDILLLVLHVILSLGIITLVLLQKGAGASAGASFGGGAGSVFGASGSSNFLSKTTAIFATAFFINSLVLAYLASNREVQTGSVLDAVTSPDAPAAIEQQADQMPEPALPAVDQDVPAADIPAGDVSGADTSGTEAVDSDVPPPAGE
jgi:preprotein translocase subunit SecG